MRENDESPIRVLHITEMLSAAGIESFIMNNYRRINRNKVQFDFLVLRNEKEFYDQEVKLLGGKKLWIHATEKNTLFRVIDESFKLYRFLKTNHYKIVHIHYTTPLRAPYLLASKLAGVKTRIYHSHSAFVTGKSPVKKFVYEIMRKGISIWGTHFFACSNAAAKWMYERKLLEKNRIHVIHNGIDIQKFKFDQKERNEIRETYGLADKFVLIHTGRFLEQKNHKFIIEVFKKLKEKNPQSYLLLLGVGELEETIKQQVHAYGLDRDVCFLGVKSDVHKYLSGSDCYIMPSLYEGLPVAAVEAECSGLPCVFSTNITDEIKLIEKVRFLELTSPISEWVDALMKSKASGRTKDASEIVKSCGYNIQDGAEWLEQFYLKHSES